MPAKNMTVADLIKEKRRELEDDRGTATARLEQLKKAEQWMEEKPENAMLPQTAVWLTVPLYGAPWE